MLRGPVIGAAHAAGDPAGLRVIQVNERCRRELFHGRAPPHAAGEGAPRSERRLPFELSALLITDAAARRSAAAVARGREGGRSDLLVVQVGRDPTHTEPDVGRQAATLNTVAFL
jgi:hypothetical protein